MPETSVEAVGQQVGHWRCRVKAWISSQTDDSVYVSVQCVWESIGYGFKVRYCSAWSSCEGQSNGIGNFYAQSATGQSVQLVAFDHAFQIPRGSSDRQVRCGANVVMPDFEPGSSVASAYITIPALAVDAPAAPTLVQAERQSDAVWSVDWTNNPSDDAPYSGVVFQVQENGGDWGAPTGGDVSISPATSGAVWQHGKSNSKYAFRVRAVNAQGASAWAQTENVYTTPAAPGSLSAAFVAASSSVQLTWTDTAPYADTCQIQRSSDGNQWTQVATPSASSTSWTDATPPDGNAWYRVRYGVEGLYGAWSQVGPVSTYTSADYPTVSITGPASPVRDRPITVTWDVGGPDPVQSQDVSLVVGGLVADLAQPPASARSAQLSAAELDDGGTGTVVVSVTDTKGLSTTAVLAVTADYWPPAAPSAIVARTCGGAAVLTLSAGESSQASETTGFDVVRVMPDGSTVQVAQGAVAGRVVDEHPPLNVDYSYQVTALSDVGKTTTSNFIAYVGSAGGYVDFPDGTSFPVILDPSHSESIERAGEAVDFAGGSPYPVWYPSTDVECSPSFGFKVLRSDYDALRNEAYASDEVWVRDGFGHVWHGHPKWTLSPAVGNRYADVSLDLTVTEVR